MSVSSATETFWNPATALQEYTQDTGSIDLDLGICHQRLIQPYSFCESRITGRLQIRQITDSSKSPVQALNFWVKQREQ